MVEVKAKLWKKLIVKKLIICIVVATALTTSASLMFYKSIIKDNDIIAEVLCQVISIIF